MTTAMKATSEASEAAPLSKDRAARFPSPEWRELTAAPAVPRLSPREQEIIRLVAKGHPNKVIADILDISPNTVATHLRRIFSKLGVASRAQMVAEVSRALSQT